MKTELISSEKKIYERITAPMASHIADLQKIIELLTHHLDEQDSYRDNTDCENACIRAAALHYENDAWQDVIINVDHLCLHYLIDTDYNRELLLKGKLIYNLGEKCVSLAQKIDFAAVNRMLLKYGKREVPLTIPASIQDCYGMPVCENIFNEIYLTTQTNALLEGISKCDVSENLKEVAKEFTRGFHNEFLMKIEKITN